MNNSEIQWTECTHNFWNGCHKVTDGCKYCYMFRLEEKQGRDGNIVRRTKDPYFYKPFYIKEPKMIFTCSMSDFFIEDADDWRDRAWATIKNTPWHRWQILTKRPERIAKCLPEDWGEQGYPNVWLGVTIESPKYLNRIDFLDEIPAPVKFISAEPLLAPIDFTCKTAKGSGLLDNIDWILLGGESGNNTGKYRHRPCEVEWMEKIVKDVKSTSEAAVFVKQMGTYLAQKGIGASINRNGWVTSWHGADFSRFPASLQIREWPEKGGVAIAA